MKNEELGIKEVFLHLQFNQSSFGLKISTISLTTTYRAGTNKRVKKVAAISPKLILTAIGIKN